MRFAALFPLLMCIACASTTGAQSQRAVVREPSAPSVPAVSVREIDWRNRSYWSSGQRFVAGHAAVVDEEGNCVANEAIMDVTFGDVDGDGSEDALLLVASDACGAGTMTWGYVYRMRGDEPVILTEIAGGDRGGGLQKLLVEGERVIVRRFDLGPEDNACCPSRVNIESWRWRDGALIKDEKLVGTEAREPKRWSLDRP